MSISLHHSATITAVSAEAWNQLAGRNPALQYAYFLALEKSGCASTETGWKPHFLLALDGDTLVGALPLYFKSHSYGEFVFDRAWAEAYELHGLRYYPKLVSSVPFTPVGGMRFLTSSAQVQELLLLEVLRLAKRTGASSFHCLFPPELQAKELEAQGLMLRRSIQFHWQNQNYQNFSDFLGQLRHDKRKKILQERRKLREAGISYEKKLGPDLSEEDWQFFYACYLRTHLLYQSPIPLSLEFFLQIGKNMADQILLIFAEQNGARLAAALFLYDEERVYGRSWGAMEYVPGLHFELCYYQAIDFCIEKQIKFFEGGAQGEHKLSRGFLPVTAWSAHWLAHPEFSRAVDDYLQRETGQIEQYVDELKESSPFKRETK